MHITQLKIAGFKSFVDPVEVYFEEGLTGIVGPNGCGKSNILESLRWAMGATSARAMRGGEMDDLIFSGSAERPARERCEVTLTIDNSARTAPAALNDEDVLEIKRMLRRGAGSTYKVNGRTVRAKDVQLLFADASSGANSPALVRQGQISELIASKPQNRRRILEEAAGIAGLNQRRHEAELKLRAALSNLEQLEQLIGEVDRQAASLKRQAGKARRYRELSDQAEALEVQLTAVRWRKACDEREALEIALRDAKRAIDDALSLEAAAMSAETNLRAGISPLRGAESETASQLGALKMQLAQLDAQRQASSDSIGRLEAELERAVSDLTRETSLRDEAAAAASRARTSLQALPDDDADAQDKQAATLRAAIDAARGKLATLEADVDGRAASLARAEAEAKAARSLVERDEKRLTELKPKLEAARLERKALGDETVLREAVDTAKTALTEAETAEKSARTELKKREAELEKAKQAHNELLPQLQEQEKLIRTLDAEIAGLDRLLAARSTKDEAPVLDETRPHKGYERALAAALGDDLNAPRRKSSLQYWSDNASETDAPGLPEGVKSLADLVDAPVELAPRLAQCGLVTTKDGARLQKQLKVGQRLVSRAGDLWRWDGFVRTQKTPSAAAERLEQQTRRDVCREDLTAARKEADKQKKKLTRAEARLEKAQATAKTAAAHLPDASQTRAKASETVLRAEQELERLFLRTASLDNNIARLEDDISGLEQALAQASASLVDGPGEADRHALDMAKEAMRAARQEERDAEAALSDFDRERERAERRRRALESELSDWVRREQAAEDRLESLRDHRASLRRQLDAAKTTPDDLNDKIEALAKEVEQAEKARQEAADRLSEAEVQLREAESQLRKARDASSQARESFARTEARLEAAQLRESEIEEQAKLRFDCGLTVLEKRLGQADASSEAAQSDLKDLENRLSDLKRQIDLLGPVNLEADAQLEDIANRMETQARERDDLTAAIAKLQEGVAALNKEGASRLAEAFEIVNAHFKSLFETLFQGGEAQLKLTESDDPLEAGLEIFACPPGKRLGTLSLMSGGEQALTATALIFAVFLSRPSPICVLDEVDAPLDDANVDRYCRLLDEMRKRTDTRFVVITHNAVTMSRMDRLFGVTMQERGVSKLVSVDLRAAEQLAAAE